MMFQLFDVFLDSCARQFGKLLHFAEVCQLFLGRQTHNDFIHSGFLPTKMGVNKLSRAPS